MSVRSSPAAFVLSRGNGTGRLLDARSGAAVLEPRRTIPGHVAAARVDCPGMRLIYLRVARPSRPARPSLRPSCLF